MHHSFPPTASALSKGQLRSALLPARSSSCFVLTTTISFSLFLSHLHHVLFLFLSSSPATKLAWVPTSTLCSLQKQFRSSLNRLVCLGIGHNEPRARFRKSANCCTTIQSVDISQQSPSQEPFASRILFHHLDFVKGLKLSVRTPKSAWKQQRQPLFLFNTFEGRTGLLHREQRPPFTPLISATS